MERKIRLRKDDRWVFASTKMGNIGGSLFTAKMTYDHNTKRMLVSLDHGSVEYTTDYPYDMALVLGLASTKVMYAKEIFTNQPIKDGTMQLYPIIGIDARLCDYVLIAGRIEIASRNDRGPVGDQRVRQSRDNLNPIRRRYLLKLLQWNEYLNDRSSEPPEFEVPS